MSITRGGTFFEDPELAIFDYGIGAPGSLTVSNGNVFAMAGATRGATSMIGMDPGGLGSVTITGAGSRIDMTGAGNPEDVVGVMVGRRGATGQLLVTNDGALTMTETNPAAGAYFRVGVDEGSLGSAVISQGGSFDISTARWANLQVGGVGGTGTMTLESGASGRLSGSGAEGDATLDVGIGTGDAGTPGQGAFNVTSGAELEIAGGRFAWMLVGTLGGEGAVTIDDAEVSLTAGQEAGVRVGARFSGAQGGSGQLVLQNEARLNIDGDMFGNLVIAGSEDSSGEVQVLSGSVIDLGANGTLRVGRPLNDLVPGGEARLEISGAGSMVMGARFGEIGRDGGRGEAILSDGGWLRFGHPDTPENAALNIGVDGGEGRLELRDGGLVSLQAGNGGFEPYLAVGRDGGTGLVEISRTSDTSAGTGLIAIGGGQTEFAGIDIGRGAGSDGTVTLDGGFFWQQNVGRTFGAERGSGEIVDLPGDGGGAFLRVGRDGGTGRLEASNGAEITNLANQNARTGIGVGDGGTGVMILDDASLVTRSEQGTAGLEVGEWGNGDGRLELRGGATATVDGIAGAYTNIGRFEGSEGAMHLSGSSAFAVTSAEGFAYMAVGRDDARGTLVLEDGSTLRIETDSTEDGATLDIGRNSTEGGEVIVRSGALLQLEAPRFAEFTIGSEGGTGSMLIDDARVELTGLDPVIRVGIRFNAENDNSGDGELVLQNGAVLTMEGQGLGSIRAGGSDGGTGRIEVLSGARIEGSPQVTLTVGLTYDGAEAAGSGHLLLDGEGSRVEGLRGVRIGENGGTGTAMVSDGAQLLIGRTDNDDWSWLDIGRSGGTGEMTIDRALVLQQGSNGFRPDGEGGWEPYASIGRDGGNGTLRVIGDLDTDADVMHGYVQVGGADSEFSTLDIGRGPGGVGLVEVEGALFGTVNRGTAFTADGSEIDLPGDGGVANIRIGVNGGSGELRARGGADIFAESGDVRGAGFAVGMNGGTGIATLTDSTLDVESSGSGTALSIGVGQNSNGTVTLEQSTANFSAGSFQAQGFVGIDGGTGRLSLVDGSVMEMAVDGEDGFAFLQLGQQGGDGRLSIVGAGSRLEMMGAGSELLLASDQNGGRGRLDLVDGGALVLGGRLLSGDGGEGPDVAILNLDGGSLTAGGLEMLEGSLFGAGTLIDAAPGGDTFMDLTGTRMAVGTGLRGDATVSGLGDLSVTGDVRIDQGAMQFVKLAGAAPDRLLIEGGLSIGNTVLEVEWRGSPPGEAVQEYLLVRASEGIQLGDTTLETNLGGAGFDIELRDNDTELWLLAGGEPAPVTVTVSGSILTRGGNGLEGVAVTFTPDEGGATTTVQTDAAGMFTFELDAGAAGRIDAMLEHAPGTGVPGIGPAAALQTLRMAVGLQPSWGETRPVDLISADWNGDGSVSTLDALGILRHAVGLDAPPGPRWLFLDPDDPLDEVQRSSVTFDTGLTLGSIDSDLSGLSLKAVLTGDVSAYL